MFDFDYDVSVAGRIAWLWERARAPIRPNWEGMAVYRRELESAGDRRVLVLGASSDLVDLAVELGASKICSIEIHPETIVAMQVAGQQDWSGVEFVVGDWLELRNEFRNAFDYVCCDGGTLFLEFPDQWRRLFEVTYQHLADGGKFVTKVQDMRGDGRTYREYFDDRVGEFEAQRTEMSPEGAMAAFRDLCSALRTGVCLGEVNPNGGMNAEPQLAQVDWCRDELRRRYPGPDYDEFIQGPFDGFNPRADGRMIFRGGPEYARVESMIRDVGFAVARDAMPNCEPGPEVCYMATCTKPSVQG